MLVRESLRFSMPRAFSTTLSIEEPESVSLNLRAIFQIVITRFPSQLW